MLFLNCNFAFFIMLKKVYIYHTINNFLLLIARIAKKRAKQERKEFMFKCCNYENGTEIVFYFLKIGKNYIC